MQANAHQETRANYNSLRLNWMLEYSSTVACFSGSGFVINRLTNRPITSTEEKVEIEFQTSLPDVHLFSAGSENQLLSLNIDNGWPTVSVQLPLLNAPGGSRAHPPGGHADEVNPELPRLLHLDIHENPNLVYRTRLDDNQPHKLVLIRRNQMLSLTVDDLLVYYRPSAINKAATKLLRTRTIILGGPSTAAQGIQGPTDRVVFEGIFTRALFIADGLQMDLLKYTLTGQHGFRIVSASTETTTTTPAYRECGQPPFTLEIHYTVVWLRTPAGHFESWPVLRVRTSSTQRWMFIGPNSRIRPVYSMLEPSTLDQYLEQFERLEDGTYGFGRHLLIGGMNFTASIEEGDYFENLLTVSGTHRSFIGCIHSVMFNDIELDLRSAVQSRGRAGRKSKEFHQVVSVGCESCIGAVNSPANGENRQCSNGTPHSYFPAQKLDGWKEGCDCSGTMHEGPECDKDSKIYNFNGRQKVRFRFLTAQRSKADQLKFIFQTDVMNASIFEASLKTWALDISKELREVYSNQSDQAEVKSCRQNNGNVFEVRLVNGHLEVKYDFLGTPQQSFTLDPEVSDNLWHSFRLTRYGSSMNLELDGQMTTTNTIVKKSELVFNEVLIGADETCVVSDDATTGDPIVHNSLPNFVGKLSQFEYNSFKFTENMKYSGSPNASSNRRSRWIVEADADVHFPSKSDVYNREPKSLAFPVMFQTQQCHLKLMVARSAECLPIKFTFRTLQTSGVLVANYNRAQMTYFLIDLVNGELRFSFSLNKEAEETSTLEGPLNEGSWHTVEITRSVENREFISLYVDRGGSDERTMQMRISFGGERDHQMCGQDVYGCLAGLTLGNGQVLDLMKPAGREHEDEEIKISCSKRLSPGCPDSPKQRCDDNLKEGGLTTRTVAGKLPHLEDVSCCVNGVGTTVHFGMLERSPIHGNSDLGSAHHSLAEMVAYAQLRLDCKEELSFLSHLAMGFQFGSGVVNLGYLGRTPEHNRRSTLFYLQNVIDESSILQLYLDSGRLMLLHTTKKMETLIAGPADNRLDDGFYHRILLFQTHGDLLLEIDGNKSFKRDVIGGTQNIWLGHDPNSNQTDFFYGYLTGVYFNGKYLLDIVVGNNHLTSAQAISYGKVERVPKFIPRLVNGSQLQIGRQRGLSTVHPIRAEGTVCRTSVEL
ncbi:unnamed protein product [Calicophoron daubneyi]|uniref:Laminin G domain-containing protein n=1 Tax=Calicophoron daubneyi TaxID=300641 RepID=A0AAV2TSR4_CALDB